MQWEFLSESMEDAQYASIGEVKKLTREAAAALAGEESLPVPPLPASNRPRAQSSRAQLQTGTTIKAGKLLCFLIDSY